MNGPSARGREALGPKKRLILTLEQTQGAASVGGVGVLGVRPGTLTEPGAGRGVGSAGRVVAGAVVVDVRLTWLSPPFRTLSREIRRRPPLGLPVGPWHSPQRWTRIGRTSLSKKSLEALSAARASLVSPMRNSVDKTAANQVAFLGRARVRDGRKPVMAVCPGFFGVSVRSGGAGRRTSRRHADCETVREEWGTVIESGDATGRRHASGLPHSI